MRLGKLLKVLVAAVVICSVDGTLRGAEAPSGTPFSIDLLEVRLDSGGGDAGAGRSVAEGTWLRIRGFGIYSEASSRLNFDDTVPLIRNDIDFEDTLGMDMDKFTGGALVGFNFGNEKRWHFDVSFNGYYDYTGTRDVGSLEFNGTVFTGTVKSELEVLEGIASISYDIWRPESPALTLTTGLDFHLFYARAQLTQVVGTQSDEYTLWVPVPAPSVALRWDITPNLYVRGSAAGLWLGEFGNFYDLSAEVGYDFTRNLGVFAGCRYWSIHVEYNDDEFDFDNSSVYAGVEVRF